jgi:hypothetical protein
MSSSFRPAVSVLLVLLALLLSSGCQAEPKNGTPDYPVTIIPPATTSVATEIPPPSWTPEALQSPTIDWGQVTLLPLRTPEPDSTDSSTEPAEQVSPTHPLTIPDPLTELDVDLLAPGSYPFTLADAEISLGRMALPVDLIDLAEMGSFSVRSIPIENYPNWRFIAFDLPSPPAGELGAVVRAPISGQVMGGTMQMINNETATVINVDHALGEEQLLRATFVYSGTIEAYFVMGQQVDAGEALFRLTRDTGRVETLGDTLILGGATLTLHAAIDTVNRQPSGIEELVFLRGVSLTPAGFLRDENGMIISPVN